jgi:hypothetical protein
MERRLSTEFASKLSLMIAGRQHPLSAPPAFVVRPRACRCYNLVCARLEIFSCSSRRTGGFRPITTSALRGASVSFAINKSARADTLAGRARAVDVTKYSPPSGMRQSARSGSSCLSRKYWVATNSGRSVMASPQVQSATLPRDRTRKESRRRFQIRSLVHRRLPRSRSLAVVSYRPRRAGEPPHKDHHVSDGRLHGCAGARRRYSSSCQGWRKGNSRCNVIIAFFALDEHRTDISF